MKIELEIPDEIINQNIEASGLRNELYIHSGLNLIAIRRDDGKWYVKTSHCNRCGECCKNVSVGFPFRDENGNCKYLSPNGQCILGIHRPFSCIMDFHDNPKSKPARCVEEFKLAG